VKPTLATLYYVHDPMCSWCWGFRETWQSLQTALNSDIKITYILGGLAADTEQTMPLNMQKIIETTWRHIQQEIPGVKFNFDFWALNQPKRSTYLACRAIIAARKQQPDSAFRMLLAIQQAYYLQAKNPSNVELLVSLAGDIGLDVLLFESDINSEWCRNDLSKEIAFCQDIGVYSFPSLILYKDGDYKLLEIDYNNYRNILNQITLLV